MLKASTGFWLAHAHQTLGEIDKACDVYLELIRLMGTSRNQMGAANALIEVAQLYRQTDRKSETIALCEQMLSYITQQGWNELPPTGVVNLDLAMSTVKGYKRNIFDKLHAHRRTEAVARARDLGLL